MMIVDMVMAMTVIIFENLIISVKMKIVSQDIEVDVGMAAIRTMSMKRCNVIISC